MKTDKQTSLKDGLKKSAAKNPDSSMGLKGPSVDKNATRSATSHGHSLGGRKTGM